MGETSLMVGPIAALGGLTTAAAAKEAVKISGVIARQSFKEGSKFSVEQFTYDFPGLFVKLFAFFIVAYAVNKIMEAVIFGTNLLFEFLKFFKVTTPPVMPQWLVDFWTDGYKAGTIVIKFWDIVKVVALVLVIYEWYSWYNAEKKQVMTPSPMTHGVFAIIVTALSLITFPEIWERVKELKMMSAGFVT